LQPPPSTKIPTRIFTFLLLTVLLSCKKYGANTTNLHEYSDIPQHTILTGGSIREASGIADSKANPGYLWVEEDSGNPSQLYLLGHDGKIAGKVKIAGGTNRDWEDIVLGVGPVEGTSYLYIADIGDNNSTYASYTFYRFPEPSINIASIGSAAVTKFSRINFKYPDSSHDAEAFLVDPNTKDIYVITKRDVRSKVYKLPYPQDTTKLITAVYVSDLAFDVVTSAALSPDSKELIVKTYTNLYFYSRSPTESIATTLSRTPPTLSYDIEQQGEAVCFALDYSGFYTLSETRTSIPATLDFYKRN